MSTSNASSSPDSAAFKNQCDQFHKQIGNLFNNDEFSDLVLIAGEKRFFVHKAILATRSEYFRTLITSNFAESNQKEITMQEADPELFEKFLRYLYSNEIDMKSESSLEVMLDTFKMANKYLVIDLQTMIENLLIPKISAENFCSIYSVAFECSSTKLKDACLRLFYWNPSVFLQVDEFSTLHVKAVEEIIYGYDSFGCFQLEDVFRLVSKWSKANSKADTDVLLANIRLTDLTTDFLSTTVRESGLYSDALILDAIATKSRGERAAPYTVARGAYVRPVRSRGTRMISTRGRR